MGLSQRCRKNGLDQGGFRLTGRNYATILPGIFPTDCWRITCSVAEGFGVAARKTETKSGLRVTPLGIVATFVTLTETVLGLALTQVTGGVQVALTVFVIVFALLVAVAFFVILWFRPFVFYSPSEFGNVDPKSFIDAMRGKLPERVSEQISMAELVEAKPTDKTAQFKLIDSLIDEPARQHIILMHERDISLRIGDFFGHQFETGREGKGWTSGNLSGQSLCEKLNGTGLIELASKGAAIQLTKSGHEFAEWLVESGLKATFLVTPLGSWGEPFRPPGVPAGFEPLGQPLHQSAGVGTPVAQQAHNSATDDRKDAELGVATDGGA